MVAADSIGKLPSFTRVAASSAWLGFTLSSLHGSDCSGSPSFTSGSRCCAGTVEPGCILEDRLPIEILAGSWKQHRRIVSAPWTGTLYTTSLR